MGSRTREERRESGHISYQDEPSTVPSRVVVGTRILSKQGKAMISILFIRDQMA